MFAERLRILRESRGLTRNQLAEHLNTFESTLRRYESRAANPSIDMLIKLSEYFGVSADYLLGVVDTPAQYTKIGGGLFKERLKQLRVKCKLTQKELGDRVDVVEYTLSRYERGAVEPLLSKVVLLAKFFGVSVDYLIGISDSPSLTLSDKFVSRPNIFAERIKDLRISKRCTPADVAKFLNLSERTYRTFERGDDKPNYESLLALAAFYEVSLDYLVGMSNNPILRLV